MHACPDGVRGIMFYRLGILGWDQPGNGVRAALNRSWVDGTLLPVLAEVTPLLPAILRGPMVGDDGDVILRTNATANLVSAQLYEESPQSLLLIALRWSDASVVDDARSGALGVSFELGPVAGNASEAILLEANGSTAAILNISRTGLLVGVLQKPGAVNVYRIVSAHSHSGYTW